MPIRENFSIEGTRLKQGDHLLDLHNDYDFIGMSYAVEQRRVSLTWRRGSGQWVKRDLPLAVELVFESVSGFRVMPRDPEMPFTEDNCLSSAGWWTDEEWCDGVMVCDSDGGNGWMRAFDFQSGAIIAIAADEGSCFLKEL